MSSETLVTVHIEEEMKTSYLDYAMSVIIGRALPDVRDGLKPVHRRILYAMHDLKNVWNKPFKKSARIVGDVIGKYHPHGDAAVYDTIVRMAQHFSMRYPIIDGQGNFGSIDGDPAAAMRYTEIRMAKITAEMLIDIEKETVDYGPNYDETLQEPLILPTQIPNLLVNGSSGIAVGMATNIPPHNLTEVVNGLLALIESPDITIEQLMSYIPGPDFPTAAFIHGREGIRSAYLTGRGSVQMRARCVIEQMERSGKQRIVISELPYQTNKARLVEQIAMLIEEKKITGISEIRDESDKDGLRVVVELKKDTIPNIVLNQLYKHTTMQDTFGIIFLALVKNEPQVLNLKQMLEYFIQHRREVVTRRCLFELQKARDRAHILEGLKIALDHIDEVVALIRKSANTTEARTALMARFGFSPIQTQAILDMRLQKLTSLEIEKLIEELAEIMREIHRLEAILADDKLLMKIIRDELLAVKERYGDKRRTEIIDSTKEYKVEDLIADEDMVVTITFDGYIKRVPTDTYKLQTRGGKGKKGMETKEGDFVKHIHIASTHSYFLIFTSKGNAYWLKVYDIPEGSRISRGKALVNLIPIGQDETVKAILPVKQFSADQYIIMATKHGIIKKSELMNYKTALKSARRAIVIEENDELIGVAITNGREDVFIATRQGMTIRFRESAVRCMGRVSRGVIATRLREGDEVIGMEIISSGASILAITENGYGKRTPIEEYRLQSRGGIGLRTIRNIEKVGHVIGVYQVTDDDDVMIMTNMGKIILIEGGQIRNIGRLTQGVRLINLQPNEKVGGAALVVDKNADKEAKAKLAAASAEVLAISELAGVDSELEELPGESADDLGSEDDPIDLPEELDEVSEEDLGDEAADEGDEGDNDEEAE